MKKAILLFILASVLITQARAQETAKKDSAWKFGGQYVFTISQAAFKDWASGGQNTRAGNSRLGLFGNYTKDKISWENNLDIAYGLSRQGEQKEFRKIDDVLELNSKYGYKKSEKWYYSALFNAKTQFSEGRKYLEGDTTYNIVSKFAAPLNVNLALGADYKPNAYASVFISPVNSKFVYVNDTSLSANNSLDPGESFRYEFGFITKMKYQKDIIENVNIMTKLDIFADYLHIDELKDIDANWEMLITLKVYKVISVNFSVNIIWDNNIKSTASDGTLGDPKLQIKEIFGAGLNYKF